MSKEKLNQIIDKAFDQELKSKKYNKRKLPQSSMKSKNKVSTKSRNSQ